MQCSLCGFENPIDGELCGSCGGPLDATCHRCDFENPPGYYYCGRCGTRLLDAEVDTDEAEHRQLTVMFCDLVGSTALSEQLEPEVLREIVRRYQEVCQRVIAGFDGHIAQYLGDGILAYFGYPQAHEDDAARAVHSALSIVQDMQQLNRELEPQYGFRLAVRVGIDTGSVVAGEVGAGDKHERLAMGQTPNIAARLQGLAEPDHVVLSAATHQLLGDYFECQPLGTFDLKGISRPVEVFEALAVHRTAGRAARAQPKDSTPLVGREEECTVLGELGDQLAEGRGNILLLGGEAGIGKSRLVEILARRAQEEDWGWLSSGGSPFFRNTGFHAIGELLDGHLGFRREDSPETRLGLLEAALDRAGLPLEDAVPFLALLLGLPPGDKYPIPTVSPARRKELTLELLVEFFLGLATQQPMVLVLEDLHWVDPSTEELLDRLMARVPQAPLLLVLTYRPSFNPPWQETDRLRRIHLERLNEEQTLTMVRHLTGGRPLPEGVREQVIERTDGVPIFVEELTKTILESGLLVETEERFELDGPLTPLAIPRTLQDSLMARLDRLPEAKRIAQQGSVLGREFRYEVLLAAFPGQRAALDRCLTQLADAQLVFQRGTPPNSTYIFKHALVQEAAYRSLLRSTRSQYHQQIAQAMAARFPDLADRQPELLAFHYTEAGLGELAGGYWQQAGQRAVERSNNREALGHLSKGLEVIEALDEETRDALELGLQTTFGMAASAIKGFAAPEVARAYERALELCERQGQAPELFWVYWGLWAFHVMRANLGRAVELGRRLVDLAEAQQNEGLLMEGLFAVGSTLFFLGEFDEAREHLERSLDLDHPERDRSNAFLTGQDVGVTTRSYLALTLWQLGSPDQALVLSDAAIAEARRISHPFSLISALASDSFLHQLRDEPEAVVQSGEEAIAMSEKLGFFWVAQGNVMVGWAQGVLAQDENSIDEAAERIRSALETMAASGSRLSVPFCHSLLAEIESRRGQREAGEKALDDAFTVAASTGERLNEPNFLRLRGQLRLLGADEARPQEAENYLEQAIRTAQDQGARTLELRATLDLARLMEGQGDQGNSGRERLEALLGAFQEGFDTRDLRTARAYLDPASLASSSDRSDSRTSR